MSAIPITADGLAKLRRLSRTPLSTGQYPDLDWLARRVQLSRQQANLCLDALVGRTPEQAEASLYERFGRPTLDQLARVGDIPRRALVEPRGFSLRTFFRSMGWAHG